MSNPSSLVLFEIDAALARDPTRIGDVFRGKRDGLTNAKIAASVGASTRGFITNYTGYIESIRSGKVPDGASRPADTKAKVRSFMDRHIAELGGDARRWLESVISDLAREGEARPASNDRRWVAGADQNAPDFFHTIQVDDEVFTLLTEAQATNESTLDDTLRRILT